MLARPPWLPDRATLAQATASGLRYPYYRVQLAEYVCRLIPHTAHCTILDIGAGDARITSLLSTARPDTFVVGLETYIRPSRCRVAGFVKYDGLRIPFADGAFEVALLLNVLHHSQSPRELLREAMRVTRGWIIVKDHVADNWLDRAKLGFLDVAGNLGSGAIVTGRYFSRPEWNDILNSLAGNRVTWHEQLSFRTGTLEALFPNRLEVMFCIDRRAASARDTGHETH